MSIEWSTRDRYPEIIRERVVQADIVLDIGAGIRPQNIIKPLIHICVEPYQPYIRRLQQEVCDDPRFVFLNSTWETALGIFPDKSVDVVFAMDVIEHLEKSDGYKLLRESERVARRQIVVFTPLGYYPQSYQDHDKQDRWGMDGGYWQTHRSGWIPEDFNESWELICFKSFHKIDQDNHPLEQPFGAIWAFRNLNVSLNNYSHWRYGLNFKYRLITQLVLKRFLSPVFYNSLRSALRIAQYTAPSFRSKR